MSSILVIQNTWYHFETTLSVYQLLLDAGYTPYIYQCYSEPDVFQQAYFLRRLNLNVSTPEIIAAATAGILVTAYPHAGEPTDLTLPNWGDPVTQALWRANRLLFISHRFGSVAEYQNAASPITLKNSLCLSPLAQNIGADYVLFMSVPILPKKVKFGAPLIVTVQAHFTKQFRAFQKVLGTADLWKPKDVILQCVGNKAEGLKTDPTTAHQCLDTYTNVPETEFYNIINSRTHFIAPLIDPNIQNATYSRERYSSNFNMAWAFEKPVFCHEWFRDVYELPGIYYNYENLAEKHRELITLSADDYAKMLQDFAVKKPKQQNKNTQKIREKLENLRV